MARASAAEPNCCADAKVAPHKSANAASVGGNIVFFLMLFLP
jgi:hypothetical protein